MTNESTSLLKNKSEEYGEIKKALSWSQEVMSSRSVEHSDVTAAALLLRDAVVLSKDTTLMSHTDYLTSATATSEAVSENSKLMIKTARRILNLRFVSTLLTISIIGLVTISFIEPPAWCINFTSYDSTSNSTLEGCSAALNMKGIPAFYVDDTEAKIQDYYPSTRIDYLSVKEAFLFECFFVFYITLHTLLCIAKDKFSLRNFLMWDFNFEKVDNLTVKRVKQIRIFRALRLVCLAFLVKGLLVQALFSPLQHKVFAVYLRILLLISFSEGVQRELIIALKMIPSLSSVAVVLFMVISFYGLIGVAAFYGTKLGDQHFSNWIEAIWTLWTSMTTVIYPDVMMAGYNENRFVALFFVSFMMITFFFLLNVMLGVVCDGYNNNSDARQAEIEEARSSYITTAFELLTMNNNTNEVTESQMMAVFVILNEDCDEIP